MDGGLYLYQCMFVPPPSYSLLHLVVIADGTSPGSAERQFLQFKSKSYNIDESRTRGEESRVRFD